MLDVMGKVCYDRNCDRKDQVLSLDNFYKSAGGKFGRRAICKVCHHKRYGKKMENQRKRRQYLIQQLPNTLTPVEEAKIYEEFNNSCALTSERESVQLDHFVPVAWGTLPLMYGLGGTTYQNMWPLKESLNKSKSSENPFEWIQTQVDKGDIDIQMWNEAVANIASKHNMTYWEFHNKVTSCHIHWRTKRLVKVLNKSMKTNKRQPYHILKYFLQIGINVEVAVKLFGNKAAKEFLESEDTVKHLNQLKKSFK